MYRDVFDSFVNNNGKYGVIWVCSVLGKDWVSEDVVVWID